MEFPKVPQVVRKVKKKQVMDELDRLKQAEKKKRRLEKALATSAAIRSELEKKKQKKMEEQKRLDEEGAAIAEAVALNVLLGEDSDSDDSCKIMPKNNGFRCSSNLNLLMGGFVSNAYGSQCNWNGLGNNERSCASESIGREFCTPCFETRAWENTEFSAGLLAAQAVSSLRIAEDAHVDSIVFDGMLRG